MRRLSFGILRLRLVRFNCDGAFNRSDNIGERDLFGRTGKGISAAGTSLGLDKAAAYQTLSVSDLE